MDKLNCPLCGGKFTGKVGSNQYFCWECCVEFTINNNKVVIYELGDDGNLLPYGEKKAAEGR
ncbi:MAG: hypothetical protein L5655_09580 [Thermosediminibacteraceae bacterium]|nr:hypothetical protein [Thermosediminibacteraceae bacterium]